MASTLRGTTCIGRVPNTLYAHCPRLHATCCKLRYLARAQPGWEKPAPPGGLRDSRPLGALPLELDTATVASVLKGPTLSELLAYGQAALSLAGSAWQAATAPFAIFGEDRWGLNVLFYATVGLLGYNLIFQAPKQ